MKYPCVKQIDVTDCAAACLSTVCKYYNKNISITTIRKYASTDKNGTNGIGLINAAQKLGFSCEGYEIEEKDIGSNKIQCPFIAHVVMRGYNHYVVVFEYDEKNVIIADPADSLKTYSIEEFKSFWTGVIFTVKPNKDFETVVSEKTSLMKMISLIATEKKIVMLLIVFSIAYTLLGIANAMFFNVLFDDIVPDGNTKKLEIAALCFAGVSLSQMLFHYVRVKGIIKLERNLDKKITLNTFKHILRLPLTFFAMRQTGEIISRLNDSYKIRDALSGSSVSVFIDTIMAIICGAFLVYIDVRLFLITALIVIFYFLFNRLFVTKIKRNQRKAMENNASVNASYVEMIKGIETIKSYGAEDYIDNSATNTFTEFLNSTMELEKNHNDLGFFLNSIKSVGYIIILSVGAFMVIQGNLSIGSLLAFYSLLGYFLSPIASLIDLQINLQGALIAFERINDINENSVEDLNHGRNLEQEIHSLEINDLHFRYGVRHLILKGITMKIPQHKRVAIVGESGCGKTTLAKLLMGFYEFEKGEILINGTSIEDINKTWLRQKIVYVSQEPYFFNGRIRDNLTFGLEDKNVSDEEIMKLAEKLHISEFIKSSPDGLSANLQEGASNISGGQKQRLALLRAFLHNPEIVILDEATSHLDTITEKAITNAIENMDTNITMIIIAHRLSTVKSCDHIFVLNDGCLIEEGNHEELISNNGYYTSLWKNI